jgi:hypothetical protein
LFLFETSRGGLCVRTQTSLEMQNLLQCLVLSTKDSPLFFWRGLLCPTYIVMMNPLKMEILFFGYITSLPSR